MGEFLRTTSGLFNLDTVSFVEFSGLVVLLSFMSRKLELSTFKTISRNYGTS